MNQPIDTGNNSFWMNGLPSDGVRNPRTFPGKNTYWLNGMSGGIGGGGDGGDGTLYTLTNADTGKFFLLFE